MPNNAKVGLYFVREPGCPALVHAYPSVSLPCCARPSGVKNATGARCSSVPSRSTAARTLRLVLRGDCGRWPGKLDGRRRVGISLVSRGALRPSGISGVPFLRSCIDLPRLIFLSRGCILWPESSRLDVFVRPGGFLVACGTLRGSVTSRGGWKRDKGPWRGADG